MAVGWEVFADVAPRDVVETVLAQHADPAPLGGLLRACGSGVVHGDFRGANLALEPGRVVVLDWGLATEAPGVIDLAWYVFVNGWRIDAPKEELVAAYVARVSDLYDERTLKLGLLGGFCWFGGLLSHELIESDAAKRERARQELGWWCRRIREAAELL
jgi:Ser/Thr protein kinase RdoA (MazF antagonist)